MEKKQAKEFAECTFKPTVSRKSVEMLQTTHKERPSLHTPGKGNLRTTYKGEQTLVMHTVLSLLPGASRPADMLGRRKSRRSMKRQEC